MIDSVRKVMTTTAALALGALALLSTGCSSGLNDSFAQDQLNQARAAYKAAKADPQVEQVAPDKLLEANMAIQDAEKSSKVDDITHFSYVAQRKVQTARAMTEQKMAEAQLQQMSKENTALLMQKRDRDARLAKDEAARAKTEAAQAKTEATQAKTEATQAKSELLKELNMKATETEQGIVLTMGDVLFETAKAELSPRAMNSIEKLADFLNNHPDRNLIIEGYTDSVGGATYNQQLSEKRADSVRQALVDHGVNEDRVSIKGNDKTNPVASNETTHGRQLNRRVEVIILNQGAAGGRVSH